MHKKFHANFICMEATSQFLIWYMFKDDLKISLPFSYEEMVNYAGNYPYFSVTDWKCAQFKIYPTNILVSKFLILFFKRMAPDLC